MIVVVAGFALLGCGLGEGPLTRVDRECSESLEGDWVANVGDEGNSLILRGAGEDDPEEDRAAALLSLVCIVDEVDVPDSVMARLDATRALDGTQSATFDSYEATWSYHPQSGINFVVETVDDS